MMEWGCNADGDGVEMGSLRTFGTKDAPRVPKLVPKLVPNLQRDFKVIFLSVAYRSLIGRLSVTLVLSFRGD